MQLSTSTCQCWVSAKYCMLTLLFVILRHCDMIKSTWFRISDAADWCFCQGNFLNYSLTFRPFIVLSVKSPSFTTVLPHRESLEGPLLHASVQEMDRESTYEACSLEGLAQSPIYSGNKLNNHIRWVHTLFEQHDLDSSLPDLFSRCSLIKNQPRVCSKNPDDSEPKDVSVTFFVTLQLISRCFFSLFSLLSIKLCVPSSSV